jgi:hypothetical protein
VELLGCIASYTSGNDLFNLRLTSRQLLTSLADEFDGRFFHRRTHYYTTHSLKLLLQISQAARTRDAIKQLSVVAIEPLYRDVDVLQKSIGPQVLKQRAGSLARKYRHHRSTSKPPPASNISGFSSDWFSLQDNINERCESLFLEALTNLVQAPEPAMMLLRYQSTQWNGYGFKFDTPVALARFLGTDASHFGLDEPVETLAPMFSKALEAGYPISGIEFGYGSHNHHWGVSTFEALVQLSPCSLANICKLSIALTMTAADLHDYRDEGFRYMLSLCASLAELNIKFCQRDRCFLTADYLATLARCISALVSQTANCRLSALARCLSRTVKPCGVCGFTTSLSATTMSRMPCLNGFLLSRF